MRLVAKKMTLCGVLASAIVVAATTSLPMMTGGCGANETLICGEYPREAGADDSGQDGEAPASDGGETCP